MTRRSGFSVPTSFARTRATASGSSTWSERTRMARSAPIARPVRSCSCDVFCPIETSTTSVPATFSLMRRASSIAISSNGLITHLTLSVEIPVPSAPILMMVSGSGTRFTVTRIFTRIPPNDALQRKGLHRRRGPSQRHARRDSTALRLAAADVEPEPARELAARLEDERRDLLLDPVGRETEGRRGDGERTDDVPRIVTDRRGDGADVLDVLAEVDRVPG